MRSKRAATQPNQSDVVKLIEIVLSIMFFLFYINSPEFLPLLVSNLKIQFQAEFSGNSTSCKKRMASGYSAMFTDNLADLLIIELPGGISE